MVDFEDRDLELQESPGLPGSVILAIIALGCMLALNLLSIALLLNLPNRSPNALYQPAGSLAIGALIMWGLIAGHRLAWQWGRLLGLIGAILYTLIGVLALVNAVPQGPSPLLSLIVASVVLFIAACLWVIFFAVGTRTARVHFGLRCPDCKAFTSKAADFFFNKAKCGKCKRIW